MAICSWMGGFKWVPLGRTWVLRTMSTLGQRDPAVELRGDDLVDGLDKTSTSGASQGVLMHATAAKVKFLGVFVGVVDDSKKKRQYGKALEKRRRVIHRLRQLQKQRKESWDKEVGRLALNAFTRGYRKALNSLRSGSKAKQAIFDKATELGMKAALTLTDQQPLMTSEDLKKMLQDEEDHFARLGWDYLPVSVKMAYENLVLAMDEACEELKVQVDYTKCYQALPIGNQRLYNNEEGILDSSSTDAEQSESNSSSLSTFGHQYLGVSAESQDPAHRVTTSPDRNYCYEAVMEKLADPDALYAAYERIKSKLQVVHFSCDEEWTDFSSRSFKHLAKTLRSGTYRFSPVNKVHVRKPGKEGAVRTIIVVHPRDQIVAEAIRLELEKIYEPVFITNTLRCQMTRSCHMALKYIKNSWKGTTWFIQFRNSVSFKSPQCEVLLRILSERIKDEEFLSLLVLLFETSMISLSDRGSRLSSLFCNIYYHQLDMEVSRMQTELNVIRNKRKVRPASRSDLGFDEEIEVATEPADFERQVSLRAGSYSDGVHAVPYCRVRYVRYAEEFVFGITGTKAMALDVLERVRKFLRYEMNLPVP